MNTNITLLLAAFLCYFTIESTQAQVTQGLLQEFKFDNASYSNTANNISFISNAGTSFVADRNGNPDNALSINVSGAKAVIPNLPYDSAARSICFWVNLNTNWGAYNMIFSYGQGAYNNALGGSISNSDAMFLGYNNNFAVATGNSLGTWYHFVLTFDGDTAKIYKNGVFLGSSPRNWNTVNHNDTFNLGIGVGGEYWFNGAVDELKIYNRAINDAEVLQIYNTESGILVPNGLLYEYRFDNNTYSNTVGTNPFSWNSGISFVNDRFGDTLNAINIANSGTVATIPNLPYDSSARSVCYWVKLNSFELNGGGFYNMTFTYGFSNYNNAFGGSISGNDAMMLGYNNNFSAPTTHNLDTWYHYVMTYDGDSAKIYKNGVLIGTSYRAWNTVNVNNLFRLGVGVGGELWFNGAIDELKIYNRALTASEVTLIYDDEKPATPSAVNNTAEAMPTLHVFPNPSSGQFNLRCDAAGSLLQVFDSNGRLVHSEPLMDFNSTINLSNLSNGFYFLRVETNKGVAFQKIAIQK